VEAVIACVDRLGLYLKRQHVCPGRVAKQRVPTAYFDRQRMQLCSYTNLLTTFFLVNLHI